MKLGIVITTYQRPDGKTPFYLKRAIDSILAQEHQDFKLCVIGDKYNDDKEFTNLILQYPRDKIYYENLPVAVEREKYGGKDKHILWCTAGTVAVNYTTELIFNNGIDYICHLDHDDYWKPNHLQEISKAIEETQADWLCTKAVYGNFPFFPFNDQPEHLVPFLPAYEGLINSSSCFNYRTIPLRPRNTYEEDGVAIPADADLWRRMAKYIVENKLKSFLINEITCFHPDEGYIRK